MGKKKVDFEDKIYDDFFSSQLYRTMNRAGNVISDAVNKAVNQGLDHLEQTDFFKNAEKEGRDFVDLDDSDLREKENTTETTEKKKESGRSFTVEKGGKKINIHTDTQGHTSVRIDREEPAAPPMKEVRLKSNVPFYALGLTWILYALLPLPMYRLSDYLIAAGVSLVVYGLARTIFKGKKVLVPDDTPQKQPDPPKAEPAKEDKATGPVRSTGDPEADRVIAEGEKYLKELAQADVRIENESISASIRRMEVACNSIFAYIAENPAKAGNIRKFINYYLPTTVKLLHTYDRLSEQGVHGENISSTMYDIEAMMQTIAAAFEKQLDNLFENEALDVSADISVLETMLQQEGLTGDMETRQG